MLGTDCIKVLDSLKCAYHAQNLGTLDKDSNLDVIGSLVYCESSALDHADIEAGVSGVSRHVDSSSHVQVDLHLPATRVSGSACLPPGGTFGMVCGAVVWTHLCAVVVF
ncbi:unnamed protein product [Timema podura]|uniref:Uncharacterized protein n=1 Tax=Timema podura TaxID=61482 RepID=A0ABN7NJC7_TIMPD|nr:unnamed protein product [Timema podura]